MKRVSYIFPTSHHYRLPFHDMLRERLAVHGIEYVVVYCNPGEANRKKGDTVDIPWGVKVRRTELPGGLIYQHGLREAVRSDFVIMQQETKLVLNYFFNLASVLKLKRVAYFGHGRNFQSRNPNSVAERLKRFWADKVDWWFAYTDETRGYVESLGFPSTQITVFNNAVDTSDARAQAAATTPARLMERRRQLELLGDNIGIFVGGLYDDKRLSFLVKAADRIRARLPHFELIVIGGGDQMQFIESQAANRPWMKVLGPRFGADKVELMMLAKVFLMPGLVGLGVVDAAAVGLPTITTAFPYHSPEIAYVTDGVNGLIVSDWKRPTAYADAVTDLLNSPGRLAAMREAASQMAETLTVEIMADLFAAGVLQALRPA